MKPNFNFNRFRPLVGIEIRYFMGNDSDQYIGDLSQRYSQLGDLQCDQNRSHRVVYLGLDPASSAVKRSYSKSRKQLFADGDCRIGGIRRRPVEA